MCVRCIHFLRLYLFLQNRNISRKISIGGDKSSMDVDLSDKETPAPDSIEIQSIVIPGKHAFTGIYLP